MQTRHRSHGAVIVYTYITCKIFPGKRRIKYVLAMQRPTSTIYGVNWVWSHSTTTFIRRGWEKETDTININLYVYSMKRFNDNSVTVTRSSGIGKCPRIEGQRQSGNERKRYFTERTYKKVNPTECSTKTYHSIQLIYLIFLGRCKYIQPHTIMSVCAAWSNSDASTLRIA